MLRQSGLRNIKIDRGLLLQFDMAVDDSPAPVIFLSQEPELLRLSLVLLLYPKRHLTSGITKQKLSALFHLTANSLTRTVLEKVLKEVFSAEYHIKYEVWRATFLVLLAFLGPAGRPMIAEIARAAWKEIDEKFRLLLQEWCALDESKQTVVEQSYSQSAHEAPCSSIITARWQLKTAARASACDVKMLGGELVMQVLFGFVPSTHCLRLQGKPEIRQVSDSKDAKDAAISVTVKLKVPDNATVGRYLFANMRLVDKSQSSPLYFGPQLWVGCSVVPAPTPKSLGSSVLNFLFGRR